MRDHGGDLDRAQARYGAGDWLDLSTGINPVPYPVPDLPARAWTALPTRAEIAALERCAQAVWAARQGCVAVAGAQGAIQLVPRLARPGTARVVAPTYNEHAGALRAQGWTVEEVATPEDLRGAALGVLVNPNNPDGRSWTPEVLLEVARNVGLLIVDESFADPLPEVSLLPRLEAQNVVVLRSFGKFYGLAGLRLGFAFAPEALIARLRALAGPWAVSGLAIHLGQAALTDRTWQAETCARLDRDAARLDGLAAAAGWRLVGGTPLFRTYDTADAAATQDRLAGQRVWSRIFPYSRGWIRLGLPGDAASWQRLEAAMAG
ncbi:MAG: threonine-phosphate decarboxylase [Rhodobacteraceae bacterium]|nr:MAG: threonine-phosphate decarboxylase [Paracoccaceae bacterium]